MKKIYTVILLLTIICIPNLKSNNNYIKEDCYEMHKLGFNNLTTNNIQNYFSKIQIKKIYPYINPIYKNKIGELSYEITGNNLKNEIDKIKDKYLNTIKKNSYKDYNYSYTNGINISKMDVYISQKDLYDIINDNKLLVQIIK